MEDFKPWPPNMIGNQNPTLLPSSPSLSSSSVSTSQEETLSTPTLHREKYHSSTTSSFSSLDSKTTKNPCVTISHLLTISTTRQINCLAIKNNSLYAASAGEITVFDLQTLAPVATFGPGSGLAKSIAFSGDRIFTAHQDRKIRVWENRKLISTLPTRRDRLSNCFFPRNYVRTRRHVRRLWIEHADAVSGLAAPPGPDGLVYSASWDKCFKVWKVGPSGAGARCVESVEAHSDAVNAVAVCPSDRTVYTGSADGEIKIWRSNSSSGEGHELVSTLREHESSVNAMALTGRGGFCSGGGDGVILVWERNESFDDEKKSDDEFYVGGCLRGHRGAVLCLAHVNGVLISGSSDRSVRVWGLGRGCLGILEGHCKPVKSLVAIPAEEDDSGCRAVSVFSGSMDGEIRAWKVYVTHDGSGVCRD